MAENTDGDLQKIIVLMQARDRDFQVAMKKNADAMRRMTADGDRDLRKLQKQMRAVDDQAKVMAASALGWGKSFVAGMAGGAVTALLGGVSSDIIAVVSGIAQIGDEARRSGLSTRDFQEWKHVAEQNRIGIDSLVDGFKELSLRSDEFAFTGKGSAAEAFERLGYSADEVARKLKDPSALMLEILGRLELMDKAAQIRIADELFGGTGGERFVELLEQGADKIRMTKDEASDLGIVMSDELIAKADQLNREFSAVASTVGVALKSAIISAAASLSDFIDGFRAFENQRSTTLQARQTEIMRERADLHSEAQSLQSGEGLSDHARSLGFGPDSAATKHQIDELQGQIDALTAEEDRIIGVLSSRTENTWAPKKDTWTPPPAATTGDGVSENTGGGQRAGRARGGRYAQSVATIREQTAALEAQGVAVLAAAASGFEYGSALDYARRYAELLTAAQEDGRDVTPELRAEIDQLAASYVAAGEGAEAARDKMEAVRESARRGEDALVGIFESVLDGSRSAKDALGDLLIEMAKVQLRQAAMGVFGGSGIGGFLGGMLTPIAGKRASGGSVVGGRPYLVNENTPNSEVFVPSQGGAILTSAQAQEAMRARAVAPAAGRLGAEIRVKVYVEDDGKLAAVASQAGAQAALPVAVEVVKQNNRQQAQAQRRK